MKKYGLTGHARARIKERGIHLKRVFKAIENHVTRIRQGDNTFKYIGNNGIEVVVNQGLIVTVMDSGSSSERLRKKDAIKKEIRHSRKHRGELGILKGAGQC